MCPPQREREEIKEPENDVGVFYRAYFLYFGCDISPDEKKNKKMTASQLKYACRCRTVGQPLDRLCAIKAVKFVVSDVAVFSRGYAKRRKVYNWDSKYAHFQSPRCKQIDMSTEDQLTATFRSNLKDIEISFDSTTRLPMFM